MVRKLATIVSVVFVGLALAVVTAGCGSAKKSGGSSAGSGSSTPVAVPASGPGLTAATSPAGARIHGGTVYFTEGADAAPNYIFPMYSPQYCTVTNSNQFQSMLYRPLYWYGNNYRPTIDYNDSLAQAPRFSDHDKTVTMHLKDYKWSNGETVTARDLVFWMNMLTASPATEWCGYVPGYFPDNVASYSAPNPHTFVLRFKQSYNPTWVTYDELSQLTPLPLAWDRTSLSQPAPSADSGHLPDSTKHGAAAVYKFLDAQGQAVGSWASSPLWKVVDGPFRLQSFTSAGQATLVPNPKYSGAPKPSIARLVELPFTSEAALYNEMRSSGPKAITIGNLPSQYTPQAHALVSAGYVDNPGSSYSFNYFPLNFNNPKVGPIFRQLYFRQALQHLVDQQGWDTAFLAHTGNPTYGPVPPTPPSPLVSAALLKTNPYPFSVSAAKQLLTSHGWTTSSGTAATCQDPQRCGAGIRKGEKLAFNIDYESGVVSVQDEMNDLQAQAKKVGIAINLTTHPFGKVVGVAVACKPSQSTCGWQAENWGAGWIYGPSYLPTGEQLFAPGAVANYESYNNPTTTRLITAVTHATNETQALATYAKNVEHNVPVVFGPTSIGTYAGDAGTMVAKNLGGYAANALGLMTPENWYFTK